MHWRFGFVRRSRIVRVIFHQVEIIPTHLKIRHFGSIKWYQVSRLIGEFIKCFQIPTVHKTKTKKYIFLVPAPLLALHYLSIIRIVEFVCLRVQLLLVTLCSIAVVFLRTLARRHISFPSASHPAARPPGSCADHLPLDRAS